MAASRTSFPSRGIVVAGHVNLIERLRGKPLIWIYRIGRWRRFDVVLPPEGIVLEQVLAGGDKRRSGVASGTSTSGVSVAWSSGGPAGGRVMMDERRMAALSGVVVASMAERPSTVHATVQL